MTNLPLAPVAWSDKNPIHTHTRTIVPKKEDRLDTTYLYNPLQSLHNLLDMTVFKEFSLKYLLDTDANTEYIKIDAWTKTKLKVEVHIFSCYCDGERVPQDQPPF
jgi:hypothetical protein